jgi:hypothetical protein
MIKLPDIWKIYFFILLGIGIGYLGSFDSKNFFILGVPTILLLKNTEFDCHNAKIKFEKQKTINHILNIMRDTMDLYRNFNPNNVQETTEKIKEIFKNTFYGMDLQNLAMRFMVNSINSNLQN